jgi:hypothetical protein
MTACLAARRFVRGAPISLVMSSSAPLGEISNDAELIDATMKSGANNMQCKPRQGQQPPLVCHSRNLRKSFGLCGLSGVRLEAQAEAPAHATIESTEPRWCARAGRECRILPAMRGFSFACLPQLAEPVLQRLASQGL